MRPAENETTALRIRQIVASVFGDRNEEGTVPFFSEQKKGTVPKENGGRVTPAAAFIHLRSIA